MSYKIAKTDGTIITTLLDGTTDTSTGLTLIGRNVPSYGLLQNENFVRLLENFADTIPPGQSVGYTPLSGTLWWDTGNQILKVYNGTNYINVSQQTSSATAPGIKVVGDQWWDTVNQQLKVWVGMGWMVIGPAYTAAQGVSGVVVDTVTESGTGNPRTVIATYAGGRVISVLNPDSIFVVDSTAKPAYAGFSTLGTGQTVLPTTTLHNTAANSLTVGGLNPSVFARLDLPNTLLATTISGGLTLNAGSVNATVGVVGNDIVVTNPTPNGKIKFNITGLSVGTHTALTIDGATGEIGVNYVSPINNNSLITKAYVDVVNSQLISDITTSQQNVESTVQGVIQDYESAISQAEASVAASLKATTDALNSTYNTLNTSFLANITRINANIKKLDDSAASQATSLSSKLSSDSPTITTNNGPAQVVGQNAVPALNDNSNTIAVTKYVDASVSAAVTSLTAAISSAVSSSSSSITGGLGAYAPKDSPVFTGNPQSAAQLSPTDATNSLATTAFVYAAIGAIPSVKFVYTVSPNTPSGGNDGDFWFQTG
jgi:hypothetical protein